MSKQIAYNEEARKMLLSGIDQVANAIKVTLGPRGRNVVLDKGYGSPVITNDGVSIAKEITLPNKFENMGAEIIKEVAEKTNETAGDGTTSSVVLTQAIVSEGLKKTAFGKNAMQVRAGIEEAVKDAVFALKKLSKPIKNDSEIKQVATIAAESEELGSIIALTIKKVGKDGVVTVEESQSFGVDSEIVEGLEFDKGYVSPYMITDAERMEAVYKDIPVLLFDKKISAIKDILPFLEKMAAAGKKDLVIIADDIEGEALTTFVVNKLRGGFNILGIKAPGYGDNKKSQLADLAVLLGAKLVSEELGSKLETSELDVLGKARKIISTKEKTIIIGGAGSKSQIQKRISELKSEKENASSKYDKEKLEARIAKLAGGVGVIKVGAATETEMKYLKLKIEDAVNATKAAIEEGIVAGGGTSLVRISEELRNKSKNRKENAEFMAGYMILVSSLEAPFKQIVLNGGDPDSGVLLKDVRNGKGYDALKGELIPDMISAGIVDPAKVVRCGLENSASAAAMLLTTEVAITDIPNPTADKARNDME